MQSLIQELIEALGGVDLYCDWVDGLEDSLSDIDFTKAIEFELERIEAEAAELIGNALRSRMLDNIAEVCGVPCNCKGHRGSCSCKGCDKPGEVDLEEELIY